MFRKLAAALLIFGLTLVMLGLPAAAQEDDETTSTTAPLVSEPASIEITDVNVSQYPDVTMTVDLRNVPDLDPDLITVLENGEPVEGLEVTTLEQSVQRIGIVLAIDTSGSMSGAPIGAAREAALTFIAQKRPQDWIAIVTFASDVQVLSGFSNDPVALASRIESIEAKGETAFYDAVIKSAELYDAVPNNDERNLIILSDGADSVYSTSEKDAARDAARSAVVSAGVRVFAVALEGSDFEPEDLQDFAGATGGRYRTTPDPSQLSTLYSDIRRELNNKLVLHFTANENQTTDVDFEVTYADLSGGSTVAVPGYITFEQGEPTTTTEYVFSAPEVVASDRSVVATSPSALRGLAAAAVFMAFALFVLILIRMDADADKDSVGSRLSAYGRKAAGAEGQQKGILAKIPFLRGFTGRAEEAVRKRGLLAALNSALDQGNIPLRPGEAIAAGIGISMLIAVLAGLFTQNPTVGIVAFAVALVVLVGLVQLAGSREKRRFEKQLPDTLTLISTSLRAGYSLLQAVEAVATEAPDPTAREFGRAIAESRLGRPVVQSLEGVAERMRSEDFEWAVMAIEIQREVGGNLAEVLQIVAETMPQRNRLRGEVKALTAEGRISAVVLGTLPIGLFAFLFVTNRSYLEPLITQTVGWIAIGIGLGLLAVGILWLRKITNIEV